ncbi:MAG: cupin domain-containing protein [Myxococcales bacterium]|nr:cupin domain-containing protein [Myxococcales bacterium]
MSEKLEQGQEKYAADERRWRDVGAGLCVLDLHEASGRRLQLVRLAPGGRILAHQHAGTEVMYIIKGSMVVDGIRLHAGDILTAPAGSVHRESVSFEGAELVIECSPDDTLLRS